MGCRRKKWGICWHRLPLHQTQKPSIKGSRDQDSAFVYFLLFVLATESKSSFRWIHKTRDQVLGILRELTWAGRPMSSSAGRWNWTGEQKRWPVRRKNSSGFCIPGGA